MNQDTILGFLLEHGPIRDDSTTRANAIKKAWEMAQEMLGEHPEYEATNAAWGFHVKNLEDDGKVVVERSSPRISIELDVDPDVRASLSATPQEPPPAAPMAEVYEFVQPQPHPSTEHVAPALTPVVASAELPAGSPVVKVTLELPIGRAAEILAQLSELPLEVGSGGPSAGLDSGQMGVLIKGYQEMTDRLGNFVSETFAAWMEMTEKIDRIEGRLAQVLDEGPDDTEPPPAAEAPSDTQSSGETAEKPLKPKLSAVPKSVSDKDLRVLYGTVAAQGYKVESSNGGHIRLTPPPESKDAQVIFGPSSPSDHRSVKNLRAQLRREGIDVP